jgi:hypothetical protein
MNQEVLDFYYKNKEFVYQPPIPPDDIKSDAISFSRWLLNHDTFAWIELDIDLNLDVWKLESLQACEYFVKHRANESDGWKSCCIHGLGIDKTENWPTYLTDESEVFYDWTPLSDHTPTIRKFWKDIFPSERYHRIRFMLLEPGGYISPHSDVPGKLPGETTGHDVLDGWPINLAIIHPKDCHMIIENYGKVPFREGKPILINIRHRHAFLNFSNENRIHLIASSEFGNKAAELAKIIHKSFFKNV